MNQRNCRLFSTLAIIASAVFVPAAFAPRLAIAQQQPSNDRLREVEREIQLRREAHERSESRRRQAIQEQVTVNEFSKWRLGAPSLYDSAVQPPAPSRDYLYGYGRYSAYDRRGRPIWPGAWDVFEPWPVAPGDVFAYPPVNVVEQPLDQVQIQTGPNRWESRPVYQERYFQDPLIAPNPRPTDGDAPLDRLPDPPPDLDEIIPPPPPVPAKRSPTARAF